MAVAEDPFQREHLVDQKEINREKRRRRREGDPNTTRWDEQERDEGRRITGLLATWTGDAGLLLLLLAGWADWVEKKGKKNWSSLGLSILKRLMDFLIDAWRWISCLLIITVEWIIERFLTDWRWCCCWFFLSVSHWVKVAWKNAWVEGIRVLKCKQNFDLCFGAFVCPSNLSIKLNILHYKTSSSNSFTLWLSWNPSTTRTPSLSPSPFWPHSPPPLQIRT